MNFLELILIAISLSMDAFAVSICQGITIKPNIDKIAIKTGLYFGFFQALMPMLGYLTGTYLSVLLDKIDHFIVFFLLGFIGFSMIKDSLKNEKTRIKTDSSKEMLILSIATSIDALAVGISLAFLKVNIIISTLTIGIICFIMSFIGVKLGRKAGNHFEKKATLIGGIILFLIGLKILIEHLLV